MGRTRKHVTSARRKAVYCLCRKEEKGFMICCDRCEEWYHGPCVSVTRAFAKKLAKYFCPSCKGYCKEYDELQDRLQSLEAKVLSLFPNETQAAEQAHIQLDVKEQEIATLKAQLVTADEHLQGKSAEVQKLKKVQQQLNQEIVALQTLLTNNDKKFVTSLQGKDAEVQMLIKDNNMLKEETSNLRATLLAKEQELKDVIEEKDKSLTKLKKRSRLSLSSQRGSET